MTDYADRILKEHLGTRVKWYSPSERREMRECIQLGLDRAHELSVRLQTDSNGEIPVRYMERQGSFLEDGWHNDVGGKPDWAIAIERVEWRATENMVYIFFHTVSKSL